MAVRRYAVMLLGALIVPDSAANARFRIMRLIEKRPQISQREIAEELGVALGRVNYILRALADKGLIKVSNFRNSSNKLRYAYILTPEGVAKRSALTASFLRNKLCEYDALKAEIEALRADLSGPDLQDIIHE